MTAGPIEAFKQAGVDLEVDTDRLRFRPVSLAGYYDRDAVAECRRLAGERACAPGLAPNWLGAARSPRDCTCGFYATADPRLLRERYLPLLEVALYGRVLICPDPAGRADSYRAERQRVRRVTFPGTCGRLYPAEPLCSPRACYAPAVALGAVPYLALPSSRLVPGEHRGLVPCCADHLADLCLPALTVEEVAVRLGVAVRLAAPQPA